MHRVDLRLALDPGLLEDRHQGLCEASEGLFGLPHVNNAEAVRALPCDMNEQTVNRPVGRRLDASLARHPDNRLLVCLLREGRGLKNRDNWHCQPP